MGKELLSDTVRRLETIDSLEMHELLCFHRLYETPNLPAGPKNAMEAKLKTIISTSIKTDPSAWGGYGLQPIDIASSVTSPFLAQIEPFLSKNFEFLLGRQEPEGCWSPPWSWAQVDQSAWSRALQDLRSHLTITALLRLRTFERYVH